MLSIQVKKPWAMALFSAVVLYATWQFLPWRGEVQAAGSSQAVGPVGVPANEVAPPADSPSWDPGRAVRRGDSAAAQRQSSAQTLPPAGLSDAQWQQLQAALSEHPQREAEIRRVTAFLHMQARVQVFAQARERGAPRTELAALARPLQAELPQHLERGEVNAAEALRLQAALFEVTESDTVAARAALSAWRERYVNQPLNPVAPDPRVEAFGRAQQAAVANWQAAGGRNAQALERELESLRHEHFATKP